jgi:pimeloyl-ACP methyl ester carboxylesterase
MKSPRLHAIALVASAFAVSAPRAVNVMAQTQAPTTVDAAFQKFWDAKSPSDASKLVDTILKTGVTYDDALKRLKRGRSYTAQKTGVVMLTNKTEDKIEHYYAVNVPAGYDPAKSYQVRFQLHGGVMGRSTNQPRNSGDIGNLAGATEQFYVLPYGWTDAPWWSDDQVLNLTTIVDSLKRTYNIDENHVVVSGVSDGATGAYYIGMRETTPFASFLPLNGFIMVLANPDTGIRDELYPNNLRNKPLYVVNGGRDRLYPISAVEPYVLHLKKAGVTTEYHPQPLGEHNTAWWPEVKESYERFVSDHPRDPSPARLTWEASDLTHGRAHWLVITKLGKMASDVKLADANEYSPIDVLSTPLFEHRRRSGRVDLTRTGNTIDAATRGVEEFTLLLSPDAFDLSQPIKVVVNGKTVFDAKVQPSLATLMRWAARDNDRTMLYAAEIEIKLAK